ncbi:MAG: aldo/keto reductase [Clostridiales bacterium]|nr:aldo/keto reductase [Clostridiales bacterium]
MKYTLLAGHKVSNISLGTVQLGINYGIANELGKPDRQKSYSMLEEALKNGITSLDTAHSYGDSEEVLGGFFARGGYGDKMPFITTKFFTTAPAGSPDSVVEREIMTSVETSLKRLGLKKVNCLLMHRPEDMIQHGDIVPRTLEKLIKEGYTDIVGASIYQPEEVETLLQNDLYSAIQIPMSLFDQKLYHMGYLERLEKRKVGVFVRSVFLQGLFFLDPEHIQDPDLQIHAAPHIRTLKKLAEKSGLSIAQFAVSFIRDLPGVTSLVLGADTPEQIKENILLVDGPPIPEELREESYKAFAGVDLKAIMSVLSRPK